MSSTMLAPSVERRFLFLLASQGFAALAQLLAGVIVARSLGPALFGHWSYAVAYTSIFASIVDFGMSFLAVRDLARRSEARRYLGNIIAIKAALSVIALVMILALFPALGRTRDLLLVTVLLGAQTILWSYTSLLAAALYATDRLLVAVALRTGQALGLAATVFIVAAKGAGLAGFAYAYAGVAGAGVLAATALVSWRFGGVLPRADWGFWRKYLRELAPLALAIVLTTVYYSADQVMLGLAGLEREVGWYNAGYRAIFALLLVGGALNQAFLPDQSRALDAAGVRAVGAITAHYRAIWVLVVPLLLLGPIAAPDLLTLVYGAEYQGGAAALQILIVAGGIMFFSSHFGALVLLAGRQRSYLAGVALGAGTNVVLNLILIPPLSLHGAAIATVLAEVVVAFWMRRECAAFVPHTAWRVPAAVLMTGVVAALLASVAVWTVASPLTAAAVALGSYGCVLWRLGHLRFAAANGQAGAPGESLAQPAGRPAA